MGGLIFLLTLSAVGFEPRFVIKPPNCAWAWFNAVELENMLRADTSTATHAYVAVLAPACEDTAGIELTVIRRDQRPEQRHVSLDNVPDSMKLRTIASAASGLLVDVEFPDPPPVGPLPVVDPPPPPPQAKPPWSIGARAGLRLGLARGETSASARAEAGWRRDAFLIAVGAIGSYGVASKSTLRVGAGSFHLGWWVELGAIEVELGPIAELGVAQIAGRGAEGGISNHTNTHLLFVLGGRAAFAWRWSSAWALIAGIELGGHLIGVEGIDNSRVVGGQVTAVEGIDGPVAAGHSGALGSAELGVRYAW